MAKQLTREIVTDATTSPGISIGGVVNGPNPVFTLFGRDGHDLAAVPGATGADVSRCAVSVQAAVTSNAHLGVTGFSETAVGELHGPRDLQGCP